MPIKRLTGWAGRCVWGRCCLPRVQVVAGGGGGRGDTGLWRSLGVCEVLVGHGPAPEAEGRGWGRVCSVAAPHEGAGLGAEGAA